MKTVLLAFCLIALGLAAPTLAQAPSITPAPTAEHTINGMPVPADQMEAVEMRCRELLSADAGAGAGAGAGAAAGAGAPTPATPATPGGARTPAAPAAPATPATPAAPANSAATQAAPATPPAGGAAPGARAPAGAAAGTQIDLTTLTAGICEAGGFTASTTP